MRCPQCLDYVGAEYVEAVGPSPRGKDLLRLTWLHVCGAEGVTTMARSRWAKIKNRKKDFERKITKNYDTEAVGRAVQGFRIELDVVETVEDIMTIWADQESHELWAVPKERVPR